MPKTVFSIFVSSTSKDLGECRAKVTEMIRRMGQAEVAMETFGARPDRPLDVCREEVQEADALVVIVGHRYGWIPGVRAGGNGQRSITWHEVQWALDGNRPVYAFLLDQTAPWTGPREQDQLLDARTQKDVLAVAAAVKGLQEFRQFLGDLTFESFKSADDLGAKVATSLHKWLIKQAVDAAKSEYTTRVERAQVPGSRSRGNATLIGHEHAYWQEQVHLLSARRLLTGGEPVTIALIAGRANGEHPALQGAALQQVNVQSADADGKPDDYTTALATLLVGQAPPELPIGVAPGSRLLVFNVLGAAFEATTGSILAAVDAALVEGARVICVPLSGFSRSDIDAQVFRRAAAQGAVVVCPAGNDAGTKAVYPAGYPDCIAMAAVDTANHLATFSNRGTWVTAAAPGVDVPVAVTEGFQKWSGTFFACGIGAGVAALMLQANPKLGPAQAKEIIAAGGRSLATGTTHTLHVVDAFDAVSRATQALSGAAKVRSTGKPKPPRVRKSARAPHRFRMARRR